MRFIQKNFRNPSFIHGEDVVALSIHGEDVVALSIHGEDVVAL